MSTSSRCCNPNHQVRRSFIFFQLLVAIAIANIRCLRAFQHIRSAYHHSSSASLASGGKKIAGSRAMFSSSSTCLNEHSIVGGSNSNPLLESWTQLPFSLPPFDKIQTDHYRPALEVGMEEHLKDLQEIVDNPEAPTFENVMVTYDRAGSTLDKVGGVFGNMCSSQNTPELQAVQTEMTPILSRHQSATFTLPGLFQKVEQVYHRQQQDELDKKEGQGESSSLTDEDRRLIERIYLDFTRSGAHFDTDKQKENADIQANLASLITQFSQNGK